MGARGPGSIPGAPIMIKGSENLHSHTLFSDGKMTHKETLDVALANGCAVLAFTDHDTLMPVQIFKELKSLEHKTKWISGIELSVQDPPGKSKGSFHVIGLFVDPSNFALQEHCKKMLVARRAKAENYVKMFTDLGFSLTVEECLAQAGEGTVGKPHVVSALIARPENVELLKKHIEEFRIKAQSDSDLQKDYDEALERSKRYNIGQFVFPIFLRPSGGAIKAVDTISPTLEIAVKLIRDAGGVAILAHWHTVKDVITIEVLEKLLNDDKLDGVETVWGISTDPSRDPAEWAKNRKLIRDAVSRTGAVASPSLDAHLKADYELLAKSDDFASQTVGMTKKILEKAKVSKEFSTL